MTAIFHLGPTQSKHAAVLKNKPTFSQYSLLPRRLPYFLLSLIRQLSLSQMAAIQHFCDQDSCYMSHAELGLAFLLIIHKYMNNKSVHGLS